MANHALGVKWNDKFSLRITDPDESASVSDPKWINIYTIPSTLQTAIPFVLNLVDVPGFSTVRQNSADEDVISNLKKFMKNPIAHEIDSFSGIWFVYQAHLQKIPTIYNRLYKELVNVYGRSVDQCITNLITFADGDEAECPVTYAIDEAGLPNERIMTFNNMLVFNKNQAIPYSSADKFEKKLKYEWSNSQIGLNELSGRVESSQAISVHISPEDLERRERTTEGLRQLNTLIRMGCQQLQVMQQEKYMIKETVNEKQIIAEVLDFEYEICKPVKVKRESYHTVENK